MRLDRLDQALKALKEIIETYSGPYTPKEKLRGKLINIQIYLEGVEQTLDCLEKITFYKFGE